MSDLRTLFISQSYTSLIHTSNDGAVPTGSYIELEDGSGNSLGIEVNRNGNFNIQGEVSASSINGIGNVTVYSASVDNRLDQLESDTGSQDNRLDLLEEFTSSQEEKNLAVGNFTSSQESKNTTLETVTSSLEQSVDSLELFTASLETNFVTSASFQSYTSSTDIRLDNIETTTASLQTTVDTLLQTASFDNGTRNITFTKADTSTFDVNIPGADITPLNNFTASQLTINSGYNSFTESTDNRLNSIETATGSYARTDVANNFTGSNNTFPLQFDLRPTNSPASGDPRFRFDSFQNRMQISLIAEDTFFDREIRFYPSASYSGGFPTDSELGLTISENAVFSYVNTMGITNDGSTKLAAFQVSGSGAGDAFVVFLNDTHIMEVDPGSDFIIHPNINARGGIDIDGDMTVDGTTLFNGSVSVPTGRTVLTEFTASLSQDSLFIGNSSNQTTQISTSSLLSNVNSRLDNIESETGSYATIDSDNIFSGSQEITGSVNGNVETITITSSTASIDCSQGNFFTLTLPTGSTHFTATNIIPGQTVSVKVVTQNNTTASIDSSTIKMIGTAGYTPTQASSEDIITFVSFDSSFLYGVAGTFFG